MNEIKDGGPAFGQVVELRCVRVEMNGDTEWEPEAMAHGGLTIRDYFAAKAMQGMLANTDMTGDRKVDIVREAYEFADEMLRARGEA
ncbi:hypothetical protein [Burkholderia vietnamiensis]|uniref:hypothetical protein n=1 Tax=Burkholderia vietnamiensis TaxID=60552 RepID=UPI00352F060D